MTTAVLLEKPKTSEPAPLNAQQIIHKLLRHEITQEEAQAQLEAILDKTNQVTVAQRIFRELFPFLRKSGIRRMTI